MAQTIKLKRSSVQNNTPSTSDLQLGELAINTYDGKLFIKKDDGSASIVQVGGIVGTSELTDGSVTTTKIANNAVTTAKLANNSVGITQLNVSDGSNGQVLTTNGSGTLSFSTVSSGASNQNAFSNVAVSGQSTIAADGTTDTLNVVAGSGIQLTTNAGTDSLTITSTATGSVTEAFKNIAVSGQSNVVADGATDTLTLVGGTNMTITTDASNDTITFASSGGGSGNTGAIDSQVFNGDGTDTTFTLSTAATTEDNLWVFVDGVYQNKDSYSVSGTTLTMADAPDNGTKLAVHHVRVGTPANGTITGAMLASPLSLTGDFAVDTNVLKVDSTNNRVGINITAPSEALDVIGNMGLAGELKLVTAIRHANSGAQVIDNDDNTYLKLNDPEGSGRLWLGDSGDATNIYRNTTHKFVNADVSTEYMRINSTGVGIGTTSPARPLHIASTSAMRVPIGTTAQRPSGAVGDFRYNSNDGKFEGYTAAGWGAIAGSGGGSSSTFLVQELTGNGSTTAFTLEKTVTSEDNLIVFNEGVFQRQDSYAASGTTITFDTAPANGNKLVVYQMETGVVGVAPKIDTMTGDGSDTTLTLSVAPASENQTIVNIDGVTQHKATYSVSGTTLTFSSPPPSGSAVECITLTNMSVTTIGDDDLDTKVHFDETADDDVIRFDTAGTERMVIGGTGNVGIGINNPARKLESSSGGADVPQIRASYNSTNYLDIKHNLINAVSSGSNDSIQLQTGGTTGLTIDVNQNATFNSNLTVTGNFTVNGTTTTLNSTSLTIDDKKITVAEGAGSSSAANESGIEIGVGAVGASSNPSILYYNSGTKFVVNKPLDVTGNITATGIYSAGNDASMVTFQRSGGAVSGNIEYNDATTDMEFGTTTAHSFSLKTANTRRLTINNSGAATFTGTAQATRVGIGVAPHATAGLNITSTAQHMRLNNGSELAIISLESGGALNIWSHGDGSNNEIKFYQGTGSGAEKMRIHGDGKVGIGTSSPTAILDVVGPAARPTSLAEVDTGSTARFRSDSSNADSLYIAEAASGALIQVNDGATNSTTAKPLALQPFGGSVGIGTNSPSVLLDTRLSTTTGKVAEFHNNSGYGIGFTVAGDGGVNTINSESNQALAFATNGATNERVRIGAGGAIDIANNQLGWYSNTDSAWMDGTMRFSNLNFKNAGGTSRMYIAGSTGNVGIGINNPLQKLDVRNGNIFVGGYGGGTDYGMIFSPADGSSYWNIYNDTGGELAFCRNITIGSTEMARFDSAGNFGIGTASPSKKLHVSAGGTNVGAVDYDVAIFQNSDAAGIRLVDAGDGGGNGGHAGLGNDNGNLRTCAAGYLTFATGLTTSNRLYNGGTERMRIDSSGNVGIGTATPSSSYKLSVHGHTQVGDGGGAVAFNFNATGNAQIKFNGTEKLRLESSGPIIPDGSLGLEQYRPVFTGANAGSYSTSTNLAYTKTSSQYIATGEHFKARVRARAYTKYVHMKTNLSSDNIMFFFRINGYFYNYGVNESIRGGYTYQGGVIAEHVETPYNSNSNFTIADFYRSSTGSFLCLKLAVQHANYTEGEALVYFSSHTPSVARDVQITDMQHRNDETNAY